MLEQYNEFVGIYDESVPVELCNDFVNNYEEAKKNRTIIDLSKENNLAISPHKRPGHIQKDEIAYITPTFSTMLPLPPINVYFELLRKCFLCYVKKYSLEFDGSIYNDIFKIHKVRKSEGYHVWHYEKSSPQKIDRLMVYMTYLEAPKEGGETEFLHQSLRIKPVVGRTLIWPAAYTHMHRGNPPLDGEKMYITGWFTASRVDFETPNDRNGTHQHEFFHLEGK